VSGLTINGFVETSLIHPLFRKFVISEATNYFFLRDDLLLLMYICYGSVLNGMLEPFSKIYNMY
jgi:hypothetical protein